MRVLAAGANLCWIGLVWPMLVGGAPSAAEAAGLALSLLLLGSGALAVGRHPTVAAVALLIGVPVALAITLALQPQRLVERAFGPLPSALLLASFVLFGAFATQASAPLPAPLEVRSTPIAGRPVLRPARRIHEAIVALTVMGAIALSAVVPLWGGGEALREAWAEAAPQAGVLTAVLGSALAVAVLTVFGGGALRPPRSRPRLRDPGMRLASYLFLALLGAVTYFVLIG